MKETPVDWLRFVYYASASMRTGSQPVGRKIVWDVSLGCHKPYPVLLASQPPENACSPLQWLKEGEKFWLQMETPCRKCEKCLENRRRLWRGRMQQELGASFRTWFGTLTINPHHRFIFSVRAGSRDYHASHREISKEVTKYFKRLRKAGYKFRYVVVAEAHKDGYPHLHMLVHEVSAPIPKKRLQDEWPYGFTTFKLVNDRAATFYVAKYLAKDARTRIRASLHYGQSVPDLIGEVLEHGLKP